MRNVTTEEISTGHLPFQANSKTHYLLMFAKSRFNAGEPVFSNKLALEVLGCFGDRGGLWHARAQLLKGELIEQVSDEEFMITTRGNWALLELARRKEEQRQERLRRTESRSRQQAKDWRARKKAKHE